MSLACPRCSSLNVRRARLTWLDAGYLLIGFFPYRCRHCFRRFHRLGAKRHERGGA